MCLGDQVLCIAQVNRCKKKHYDVEALNLPNMQIGLQNTLFVIMSWAKGRRSLSH